MSIPCRPSSFDAGVLLLLSRSTAGAFLLRMSHGYILDPTGKDQLTDIIAKAAKEFYLATRPGAWIVDAIPFRAYSCHFPFKAQHVNSFL